MAECPDCGQDHPNIEDLMQAVEGSEHGMVLPAVIYGGGLSEDQKRGVEDILEAIDRAQIVAMGLAQHGAKEGDEWEPLRRVVTGIADGAVLPIVQAISKGENPVKAVREILAAVGAMMFIAGTQFQRERAAAPEDRRPRQPLREKMPDPSPEEMAEMKDLFARLGELEANDEED